MSVRSASKATPSALMQPAVSSIAVPITALHANEATALVKAHALSIFAPLYTV